MRLVRSSQSHSQSALAYALPYQSPPPMSASNAYAADTTPTAAVPQSQLVNLHLYNKSVINANHTLKFGSDDAYNQWTRADGGVRQGMVAPLLQNGFPMVASKWATDESLDYLFTTDNVDGVTTYSGVSGLVQRDENGFYYYSSDENFASYDSSTNSIDLASRPHYDPAAVKKNPALPQFLPFNSLLDPDNASSAALTPSSPIYNFGLDATAQFVMPENGQVNGQNMIFEFNGDDDVWVYIDDVLVLDMGGSHDSYDGYIDFVTGEVYVQAVNTGKWASSTKNVTTTISAMFETAGKTWNPETYSEHTLRFFYLEHGGGGSNFRVRYNLPAVPDGSLEFGKQVDYSQVNSASSVDDEYQFQAFVNYDGTSKAKTSGFELYTGDYQIMDSATDTAVSDVLTTDTDGVITLHDGQYARLLTQDRTDKRITVQSNYYVKELGATSDKFNVTVEDTQVEASGSADGMETGVLSALSNGHIVFKNSVSADNSFDLKVTKASSNGIPATDDFRALVTVGGKAYAGSYDLYSESGDRLQSDVTTKNGIITLKAGQYALIKSLAGGSTVTVSEVDEKGAAITNKSKCYSLPTYSAEDASGTPLASTSLSKDGTVVSATANEGNALGATAGQKPTMAVTITNHPKARLNYEGLLQVTKTLKGASMSAEQFRFCIYPENADAKELLGDSGVQFYRNPSAAASGEASLVRSDAFTFTQDDVGRTFDIWYYEDILTVPKYCTVDRTVWKASISVQWTSDAHEAIKTVTTLYASYDRAITWNQVSSHDSTATDGSAVAVIPIVNTIQPLGLVINKVSSAAGSQPLEGAKFSVYANNDGQPGALISNLYSDASLATQATDGTFTTGSDGRAGIYGLDPGTYWIGESTAPAGYQLLGRYIKLEVGSDRTTFKIDGVVVESAKVQDGVASITIANSPIPTLPTAGGMGIIGIVGLGMGLIAAGTGIIVSVMRRRRKS